MKYVKLVMTHAIEYGFDSVNIKEIAAYIKHNTSPLEPGMIFDKCTWCRPNWWVRYCLICFGRQKKLFVVSCLDFYMICIYVNKVELIFAWSNLDTKMDVCCFDSIQSNSGRSVDWVGKELWSFFGIAGNWWRISNESTFFNWNK